MTTPIKHFGTITQIEGNHLWVSIERTSACASCTAAGFCNIHEKKQGTYEIYTQKPSAYQIGEVVEIELLPKLAMKAVLLAYVLPLIILLCVLVFTSLFVENEAILGLVALFFLALYFLGLSLFSKRLNTTFRLKIRE